MSLPDYNSDENFCRVYLIPDVLPKDFHFGGGTIVVFTEVDWFNPIPSGLPIGPESPELNWDLLKEMLTGFLKEKPYYDPSRSYLVLTYWGDAFTFGAPLKR